MGSNFWVRLSECLGWTKVTLKWVFRGERAPATCRPYRGVAVLGETLSVAHLRVCSQQTGHCKATGELGESPGAVTCGHPAPCVHCHDETVVCHQGRCAQRLLFRQFAWLSGSASCPQACSCVLQLVMTLHKSHGWLKGQSSLLLQNRKRSRGLHAAMFEKTTHNSPTVLNNGLKPTLFLRQYIIKAYQLSVFKNC